MSLTEFGSVSDLLKAYADFHEIDRNKIHTLFDQIDSRTISSWIKSGQAASRDSLIKASESIQVPVEVLLRLNIGMKTHYDFVTRRYSTCAFDVDFVNKKILQQELFRTVDRNAVKTIDSKSSINTVLVQDRPMYLNQRKIEPIVRYAVKNLASHNLIMFNGLGHYVGHLVCLNMSASSHAKLVEQKIHEMDLRELDMAVSDGTTRRRHLHIYSFFAVNSCHAYHLLQSFVLALVNDQLRGVKSSISWYAATEDSMEVCEKMELNRVYTNPHDEYLLVDSLMPAMFSSRCEDLDWLQGYYNQRAGVGTRRSQ